MYQNKTQRANALNELVNAGALTPEGKRWLIEALDPFHDEQVIVTGFPDMNVADSVVQVIKKQQTLKKGGVLSAGNWDANIVVWPQPQQNYYDGANDPYVVRAYSTTRSDNNASIEFVGNPPGGIKPFPVGGVTAYLVNAGGDTYGGDSTPVDVSQIDLSLDTTYLAGSCRVIGMGLEVVNSTAEIYRQGQVTVYRQPMPDPGNSYTAFVYYVTSSAKTQRLIADFLEKTGEKAIHVGDVPGYENHDRCGEIMLTRKQYRAWIDYVKAAEVDFADSITRSGYITVWAAPMPPRDLGDATLLAGSKTWEAKKGCYLVSTLNTLDNPAKTQKPQICLYWNSPIDADGGSGLGIGTGVADTAAPATDKTQPSMQYTAPFNLAGAFFSGLSDQTTLTINVNWYVERFPTPQDKDLVVMASPSPGHDALAMDIYAKAMRLMPVGVQQNENPFGEWFQSVVRSIGKIVVPALKTAGVVNPMAGALGVIGEQIVNALGPEPTEKKKGQQRKRGGNNNSAGGNAKPAPVRQKGAQASAPSKRAQRKKGGGGGGGGRRQVSLEEALRIANALRTNA